MTMHMPPIQFDTDTKSAADMHPLANPHVLRVVPFWMGGDVRHGDLTETRQLFDNAYQVKADCLLHLSATEIAQDHGEDIAAALDGRTGLYVIVDDIENIRHGVRGQALGSATRLSGVVEYVVETPAGLIIFAQAACEPAMACAA